MLPLPPHLTTIPLEAYLLDLLSPSTSRPPIDKKTKQNKRSARHIKRQNKNKTQFEEMKKSQNQSQIWQSCWIYQTINKGQL